LTEEATSAVSVLVIDWTTTGTLLPTLTPPMLTVGVFLRLIEAMELLDFTSFSGLFRVHVRPYLSPAGLDLLMLFLPTSS
jgi:hypothetical protein